MQNSSKNLLAGASRQHSVTPTMLSRRQLLHATALAPLALASCGSSVPEYDLLIRGGRVLDPSQQLDLVADVAILDGKIATIQAGIDPSSATEVIEADGKLVTPGLIDIHAHVADPGLTPQHCLAAGVTSLIDGGSRGASNVGDLVQLAQNAPNRIRIFLNISNRGLADGPTELLDIEKADVPAALRAVEASPDWIVGIKARLSRSAAADQDLEALRRVVQVAGPSNIPIMIHIGDSASPLPDLLALLRPGDIVTHMYAPAPHGILDDGGRVLPQVIEARQRGIRFDFGNGRTAHWTWEVAEQAAGQGFLPDTISTDITEQGLTGQVFNLPHVMSKFLLLGMPLEQVIACVTSNAAPTIPDYADLGTLREGAVADVAVLDLREGSFEFEDNYDGKRTGERKLVPFAVVAGGRTVQV